jgi:predicted ArsR family transcriptional regulator
MTEWSFLTNHARVLVCIAHDPGVRLRDIATKLGITERSAYAIVTDLTAAGYVVKAKDTDGRRNRYQIQSHLPLPETIGRERTVGEVLDVLVDSTRKPGRRASRATARGTALPPRASPARRAR